MSQTERNAEDARTLVKALEDAPRKLRDSKLYEEINIGGVKVTPDNITQQRIMAARIIAKENADYTVNWKTNDGFIELSAAQIIGIADSIRNHVQKCFDAENVVLNGSYSTIEQLEEAFNNAYAA